MSWAKTIFNFLRFNNKNWKAVVLSVFAAMIFWFFNALNKEYTTNITFPVAFDYNQKNYVSVEPLPQEISLNVTAVGWNLFRRSIGVNVPALLIPLERPSEVRKIVGSTLPGFISDQLKEMQINFVLTDTLFLHIEPKAGRWISLSLDSVSQHISAGYGQLSEVSIQPDSIFIEGPIYIVTALKEPYPLLITKSEITSNFDEEVEVVFTSPSIRRNPPTVRIKFDVGKLVEVTDSLSLELVNVPSTYKSIKSIKKISATFRIAENAEATFQTDSVKAIVDLLDYKKGKYKVLPKVVGLPKFVELVQVDSVNINN